MGAVRLLVEAGVDNWIAGPTLNIFNPTTLQLMIDSGATRWAVAPEMSGAALAEVRAALARPIETEVFAYGRLPLAHSARCFTARHFNLQKDTCEFRCLSIMDGITLRTREGAPFLTLNGVQTRMSDKSNLLVSSTSPQQYYSLLCKRGAVAAWINENVTIEMERDSLADADIMVVNAYAVVHAYGVMAEGTKPGVAAMKTR